MCEGSGGRRGLGGWGSGRVFMCCLFVKTNSSSVCHHTFMDVLGLFSLEVADTVWIEASGQYYYFVSDCLDNTCSLLKNKVCEILDFL